MVPLVWEPISLLDSGGIGSFLPAILCLLPSRYELSSYVFFHQLLGFHVCGQHFVSSLVEKIESFFESGEEGLSDLWIVSQFISENEAKQGLLSGQMSSSIVCEFHHQNKISPLIGLTLAKHLKIHFNLLVYSFSFSICLWMVCSG